jgi:ABC-2 type transport system permease protein
MMSKTLLFFFYLLKTSIRSSISLRGAFLFESVLMIMNNLLIFSIWWIFFRQFNDIAGWQMKDMLVLMTVGIGSYGLMQICFGAIKHLSRVIVSGDLDPFMTQPKNLLLHFIASKSFSKGWGNLLTAGLLMCGGHVGLSAVPIILLSILCGCLVFASVGIITHSFAFWLGSVESLSQKYCESLFLFALYPTNIYSGFLQLVMFTLLPAGIISYLPVELIRDFSWLKLFLLIGSSLSFFLLAFFIFNLGLKRYESGNTFGIRL